MWAVIGGCKSGLAVRAGKEKWADELPELLSTGAVLKELEVDNDNLHFELVDGTGPATGWVSTSFKGKDLVVPVTSNEVEEPEEGATEISPEEEVVLLYSERFGRNPSEDGSRDLAGVDEAVFNWQENNHSDKNHLVQQSPTGEIRVELVSALQAPGDAKEDAAQAIIRALNEEESSRKQKDSAKKEQLRSEYGIGWKPENIPVNMVAMKVECEPEPQGMCCLVLDEGGTSMRVATTVEPAAAVNLEYLSTALQVRRLDGREPFFSLDPVDSGDSESMQQKRFEPEWLGGTSVGEVMFQADYHLKELSMGEYDQPVVGMKSCFDFFSGKERDMDWNAREWFVVKKADVLISDDDALIPYVRMGVEAREQLDGATGLEDAPVTRPDHPLARYAEVFTHNFDLIAERKSVVHQLREVARASVLAKYLMESGMNLDDSWFNLASKAEDVSISKVPQLWNERYHSHIHVQNGEIIEPEEGLRPRMNGVYGGVQFGLEKFTVGARAASASVQFARVGARGPMPRVSAALSMATSVTGGLRTPAMRAAVSMRAGGVPRGVDLNLDEFDLSETTRVSESYVGELQSAPPMGSTFWWMIEHGNEDLLSCDDAKLLRDIFNPKLSDRREEGDYFVPPATTFAHVEKLRALVKEENMVQEQRKKHFLSGKFAQSDVGPLFPFSWQAAFRAVPEGKKSQSMAGGRLAERPDFAALVDVWNDALKSAEPMFDKCTEEGTRFRVYRCGNLEVRTTQEADYEEVVGAVFAP